MLGWKTANELYNQGYRSPQDLYAAGLYSNQRPYHDDLQEKMTRSEVESVANFVRLQLERVEPGAHSVLCGG